MTAENLSALVIPCGAGNASVIDHDQSVLSADFREICKGSACGGHGFQPHASCHAGKGFGGR